MNLISRLLQYQPFLQFVSREICGIAQGRSVFIPRSREEIRGCIQKYHVFGRPWFDEQTHDCVGNTCAVAFSGRGRMTGYGQQANNLGIIPFEAEADFAGFVHISWPDSAEKDKDEQFPEWYQSLSVTVMLECVGWPESEQRLAEADTRGGSAG